MGAVAAMAATGVESFQRLGMVRWLAGEQTEIMLKATIFLFFSFWFLQLKFKWGKIDVLV